MTSPENRSPELPPLPPRPGEQPQPDPTVQLPAFDPNTAPVAPVQPAQPDPEQGGGIRSRLRAGMDAARVALTGQMADLVSSDMRQATTHRTLGLRQSAEKHKATRVVIDPLTGRTKIDADGQPITEPAPGYPFLPITNDRPSPLYRRESRRSEPKLEKDHPFTKSLTGLITEGRFHLAARTVMEMDILLRNQSGRHQYFERRLIDKALPDGSKRQDQIHGTYQQLSHDIYDTVMGVENERIPPQSEERPETNDDTEGTAEEAPRDWSDELNLYNIQALKSHVLEKYKKTGGSSIRAKASMENSGILGLDPQALAAYLNVDLERLQNQIRKGPDATHDEKVVPKQVLTKLNFFMTFADEKLGKVEITEDVLPENLDQLSFKEISDKLADFNDTRPESTAPMDRVRKLDEPKPPSTIIVPEDPALQALIDRSNRGGRDDRDGRGRRGSRDTAEPLRTIEAHSVYANDPQYAQYFDSERLSELDAEIGEQIRQEAREERARLGVNILPDDEFNAIKWSIRERYIDDYAGSLPPDVIAELKMILRENDSDD